jgi:hypothetical protein
VDFKPDAVRLLVDRLKKNKKVGAACGRIHPIGSGMHLMCLHFALVKSANIFAYLRLKCAIV